MRLHSTLFAAFAFVTVTLHAGPVETAIVAAMKIADAPNYAWVSTVVDDARTYTIDGKTERTKEISLVTLPAVGALRRRLGQGGGNSDNAMTVIYRGSEPLLVQVGDTWKAIDELPSPVVSSGRPKGGWAGPRPGTGEGASTAAALAFSTLQLTLSRPHEEIAIIVANSENLRVETDGISGTLAETGAKLLLVHPGQDELTPLLARGRFRLWIGAGALVKYRVELEGTLAVATARARREVVVHQRATTVLNEVGTTKFAVPPEAKSQQP